MKDDVRKYIYGALIAFLVVVLTWVGIVYVSSCGLTFTCQRAAAKVDRTPIPTLFPATMPAAQRFIPTAAMPPTLTVAEAEAENSGIPLPSNPGGAGEAVNLTGNAATGADLYAVNCIPCHGAEGVGGIANFGSTAGVVPALNPVNPKLKDPTYKTFAVNLDLFIEHGSTPTGTNPIFLMPPWGSSGTFSQQQIADVIAYLISLNP
ncbi:MAG: cytochrome c [Anaerolineales bacterium]|nr:cytochrome c [Anaerolineales bacterium]